MADPLQDILPGETSPLVNRVQTINKVLAAARLVQRVGPPTVGAGDSAAPRFGPAAHVWVQNTTGGTLDEWSVLAPTTAVIDPEDSPLQASTGPVVDAAAPVTDADAVVILIQPIGDGAIGRAVASGVAVVRVAVTDTAHRYARPVPGNLFQMTSADSGPARLLCPGGTGTYLTLVLLGAPLPEFGDVFGPATSTDNAIARFDGTTGKLIQTSDTALDDNGSVLAWSLSSNYGGTAGQSVRVGGDAGGASPPIVAFGEAGQYDPLTPGSGGLGAYLIFLPSGGAGPSEPAVAVAGHQGLVYTGEDRPFIATKFGVYDGAAFTFGADATTGGLTFKGGVYTGGTFTGGTGTVTSVAATAPAAGFTISGSPVTGSGTFVFALADDLAALEALSGTNTIYYRSAANTWTAVTIGSNLTFSGGTLSASAGTTYSAGSGLTLAGTVFAVDAALVPFLASANVFTAKQTVQVDDATNNAASDLFDLVHTTSGTAAAGIGGRFRIRLEDGGGTVRTAYQEQAYLADVGASWRAGCVFYVWDSVNSRIAMEAVSNGSAAQIGFLGATPSAQLASPDLGTLATTFGLASGTPTFGSANLTGTLATARLPGGDWVTASGGFVVRASDVTLGSSANTLEDVTDLTVSLPAAGTYWVTVHLAGVVAQTGGTFARIFGALDLNGSAVANSQFLVVEGQTAGTTYIACGCMSMPVTAAGAHTLKVRAKWNVTGGGTMTDKRITAGTDNKCSLSYVRIA